jgi:hypothetical protein
VDGAKKGCQNASKGRLQALYAPRIYPCLLNRAQIIVYSFTIDVFDPPSYILRGIVLEFVGIFFQIFHKNPWCEKNYFPIFNFDE